MSVAKRIASVDAITSIWDGAPAWTTSGSATWSQRFDIALRDAVSSDHPLVLVGRNSNESGRGGAHSAADDLHLAATALAEKHGWDVRSVLPSRDFLADALMASGIVVRSREVSGREFINRFLLVDLRTHGLVLSVSAGSGKKMTEDFQQPHVLWLGELAKDRDLSLGGFFFKRSDRMSREYWAQGPLLHRLRHLESERSVWVADGQRGRWDLDSGQDIIRFVEGTGSTQEADAFAAKRISSQRELTGAAMKDHKVPYALTSACPPGTYRFQDQGNKRWYLAIDSPRLYPREDEVAGLPRGVPQVMDARGDVVDQSETIQWLLSTLGKPGQGLPELWPGLIARRYSTEALRLSQGQGPRSYYGGPSKPFEGHSWDPVTSWSRSIIYNLDFYETGTLVRSLGPGHPQVSIANCLPPDGKWAEAEDFERIRRYLRNRAQRAAIRTSWSWSGMPVTVNGVAGRLAAPRSVNDGLPVRWAIDLDEPLALDDPAVRGEGFAPTVPDDQLTKGIIDSLLSMNGRPVLAALGQKDGADEASAKLAGEIEDIATELAALRRRIEAQQDDLYEEDLISHERVMPRLMRAETSLSIECNLTLVASLNEQRTAMQEQLASLHKAEPGVEIDDLQIILDGLRDPRSNVYRERLRRAVRRLDFTVTAIKRDRLRGRSVTFTGDFALETASGQYRIPFAGAYEIGAASQAERTALAGIAHLRAGKVAPHFRRGSREAVGIKLGLETLGVRPDRFALRSCLDSRLLQLGMAALFPNPAQDEPPCQVVTVEDLAHDPAFVDDFGDVVALSERLEAIYSERRSPRWLEKDEAVMEVDLMTESALRSLGRPSTEALYTARQLRGFRTRICRDEHKAAAWTWPERGQPRLAACILCQGPWLVPVRIPEVAGYLCLECRRDSLGISWPYRFDRFVGRAATWRSVGAPLSTPETEWKLSVPEPTHRERRPIADLAPHEVAGILDQYLARDIQVTDIASKYDINAATLMRVVREANVPTRYAATRKRWNVTQAE